MALIFQSTSSVWRMTEFEPGATTLEKISIHILRVEDDMEWLCCNYFYYDFNPHPPCGGWHKVLGRFLELLSFQSTSSVWRMTLFFMLPLLYIFYFNPHPPCGGWQQKQPKQCQPKSNLLTIFTKITNLTTYSPYLKKLNPQPPPTNSSANPHTFYVHLRFALKNQRTIHIQTFFYTNMLHFIFVIVPQIIKTQTIFFFIN